MPDTVTFLVVSYAIFLPVYLFALRGKGIERSDIQQELIKLLACAVGVLTVIKVGGLLILPDEAQQELVNELAIPFLTSIIVIGHSTFFTLHDLVFSRFGNSKDDSAQGADVD